MRRIIHCSGFFSRCGTRTHLWGLFLVLLSNLMFPYCSSLMVQINYWEYITYYSLLKFTIFKINPKVYSLDSCVTSVVRLTPEHKLSSFINVVLPTYLIPDSSSTFVWFGFSQESLPLWQLQVQWSTANQSPEKTEAVFKVVHRPSESFIWNKIKACFLSRDKLIRYSSEIRRNEQSSFENHRTD